MTKYEYYPSLIHLRLTQAIKDAVLLGKEWKHMHYAIKRGKHPKDSVYYGFDLLVHDQRIAFVVPHVYDDSILCVYVTTESRPSKMYCDVLNDIFTALGMGSPFTWVKGTENRYAYIYDTSFIRDGQGVLDGLVRYDRYTSYKFEPKF